MAVAACGRDCAYDVDACENSQEDGAFYAGRRPGSRAASTTRWSPTRAGGWGSGTSPRSPSASHLEVYARVRVVPENGAPAKPVAPALPVDRSWHGEPPMTRSGGNMSSHMYSHTSFATSDGLRELEHVDILAAQHRGNRLVRRDGPPLSWLASRDAFPRELRVRRASRARACRASCRRRSGSCPESPSRGSS